MFLFLHINSADYCKDAKVCQYQQMTQVSIITKMLKLSLDDATFYSIFCATKFDDNPLLTTDILSHFYHVDCNESAGFKLEDLFDNILDSYWVKKEITFPFIL